MRRKIIAGGLHWAGTAIVLFGFIVFSGCTSSAVDDPEPSALSNVSNVQQTHQSTAPTNDLTTVQAQNTAPESVVDDEPPPTSQPETTPEPVAPNGTYNNVYGNTVPNPYQADSIPAGASAQCGDGSYSFSQSRRGTCSHHGGVATWY